MVMIDLRRSKRVGREGVVVVCGVRDDKPGAFVRMYFPRDRRSFAAWSVLLLALIPKVGITIHDAVGLAWSAWTLHGSVPWWWLRLPLPEADAA